MKIKEFVKPENQMCTLGKQSWYVTRLFELSRELPVMDIPLDHLNIYYNYKELSLRDMVMHFKTIQAADLSFPIILDEDGELFDGRHRVMKALIEGKDSIKAVRFDTNPLPCQTSD